MNKTHFTEFSAASLKQLSQWSNGTEANGRTSMERSIAVEPTIRSNAGILSDVRYKVPYKFVLETQVHIVYFEDSGQRDSLI